MGMMMVTVDTCHSEDVGDEMSCLYRRFVIPAGRSAESYPPPLGEELDHLTLEWANHRPVKFQASKYEIKEVM